MEEKKVIILDLTDCKYWDELHERIRVAFDFPEWYGHNWDAFWDLLRSECDADEVIIRGENTLSEEFKEDIEMMHKTLIDFELKRNHYATKYEHCKPFNVKIED